MKRNKFVTSLLALSAAPLVFGFKNQKSISREMKGFKTGANEGRIHGHPKLKGINSNILDFHHFQDEVFFVIDGEYYFQVGEEKYSLKVGEYIFMPRKVPHAWTQVSEKGKLTVTFQPAGKMEEFFITMAGLENEPSAEEVAKIFAENEMQIVGPTLKII